VKISNSESSRGDEYFDSEYFGTNLKNHAVKGAGATLVSSFSTFFIQMSGVVVLARLLKPNDFGLVAMVTSIYGFFQMLRNFGLTEATIQEKEINHKKISTLFWVNVAFSIFITLVFMALGPFISWFYKEPRITWIAIVISLDLFLGGLGTQHRALLIRSFQFYKNVAIEIPAAIMGFGTAIFLAWNGWGYWAIVSRWVVSAMAQTIGAWIFCKWRPGLPSFGTGIRPMIKFGMNMLGNFSVSYFSRNIDKILIGWRFGSSSLGYYDRAYYLFSTPTARFSTPLVNVANVTLSKLREDPEKYRRYYLNAVSTLSFIGFPVSAMITVMSKDVVLLILGPQWEKAAKILFVFGFAIGIQMIYGTCAWIHLSLGKSDRLFRWNIIGSICIITSCLVGLNFGLMGVVIAYTASMYILIGPCLWYAGKIINLRLVSIISVIWKNYLSALCAGLFLWYIFYSFDLTSNIFFKLNIITRLATSFTIFVLTYMIMVLIFFRSALPITQFISFSREMFPMVFKK
jgi:PST family polysaccharide transporter